jgi:hypothetical protein
MPMSCVARFWLFRLISMYEPAMAKTSESVNVKAVFRKPSAVMPLKRFAAKRGSAAPNIAFN